MCGPIEARSGYALLQERGGTQKRAPLAAYPWSPPSGGGVWKRGSKPPPPPPTGPFQFPRAQYGYFSTHADPHSGRQAPHVVWAMAPLESMKLLFFLVV